MRIGVRDIGDHPVRGMSGRCPTFCSDTPHCLSGRPSPLRTPVDKRAVGRNSTMRRRARTRPWASAQGRPAAQRLLGRLRVGGGQKGTNAVAGVLVQPLADRVRLLARSRQSEFASQGAADPRVGV